MKARKFVHKVPFDGMPKISDFEQVEEDLPDQLQNGEILTKAEWLTVDPYMRLRSEPGGNQMVGSQLARVLQSKCPEFPEGTLVVGGFGWRDFTIYKPEKGGVRSCTRILKLPDMKGLPDSYALGAVGMPGNTAYFALKEVCRPQPGETIVVTAAAGAVGSIACQIAKIKGCKVIAFAGSNDKIKWLKDVAKVDFAFNYKGGDLDAIFNQAAPEGIDCYLDLVGGDFNYHVVKNMKEFGRIAQAGSISTYNTLWKGIPRVAFDYATFRQKHIRMEAMNVSRFNHRWFEGLDELRDWIVDGEIQVQERVTV